MKWNLRRNPTVAIVGCTGAVGRELIRLIEERAPAFGDVHLLASESSAGTTITIRGKATAVQSLHGYDFSSTDIAFFAVGAETSDGHVPRAAEQGCLVIDKSSAFRMKPEVPLVVPQVNAHAIAERPDSGIIASPNCSTIPLVRALAPVHATVGVRGAVVSTYQAASGVGLACIDDLLDDSRACLDAGPGERPSRFPRPLAFNVVPQIDVFCDDGFTVEEQKMVLESRKILGDPGLAVTATTVRVPVVNVHSEAVYVQCARPTTREEIIKLLRAEVGLIVEERIDGYATPRFNPDPDAVTVGRIRTNPDNPAGVWMWIVADNLRPGAALNALDIAALAMKLSR
ncbi:MAG: aspartate-semialdehyde dehydrogenase [Candidatus Krumholzibacteria bacterium]|nr:aspartate-semialdehyde dehydrogenase [Candidatus Krumholzibacteria bacterium]MDH4337783.1 aspartate-semialdehyde dehydrogenase [Candidatus Krumholzibacteria bacterium]MDH5270837.1 aspartate-semialdehyde dehydrogenase [Candidatus Krumholzibacteria bacterium]MDH5627386.1 aspartate-semialdehyde dehydrogenase [Candidatus Krumholzibacteria bacterium]